MYDAYVKADSIKGIYDITAAVAHEVPITLNPATLLDNPSIIRWVSEYSIYYALKTEFSFVQLWKNEENPLDENIGMIHTVAPRTSDAPLVL
uniref:Uncharacterized protein n=1 Tax=Panagrolaimus sp. ES5 TaxID=591445 RepID=A0AC34GGU2_9BILA